MTTLQEGKMPKRKTNEAPRVEAAVLTIEEAVQKVRLSRASLYRAMDAKQLRYLKYGSRRLIAKEDLDAFIASLRT